MSPHLKSHFDYFGIAVGWNDTFAESEIQKGIAYHANSITMGNEFKPDFIFRWSIPTQFKDFKGENGKTVKDRKELINTIPCVLFCHDDLEFSVGEPERRRFFIDQCLSMYDVIYIDYIRKYKQILKNRNIVLKEEKYDLLEMYDSLERDAKNRVLGYLQALSTCHH